MALFSAFTVIRLLSIFHITVAYFLLVSPRLIAEQTLVVILGEAMQMPHTQDWAKRTEVTAFAALLLGLLGLSDFVASSLPEITSLEYWISQVPIRLFALFGVTAYTYLFKEGGMFGSKIGTGTTLLSGERAPGELVQNNLVFVAGFLEVSMWFWVFVLLREERRNMAVKLHERRHERAAIYGKDE